MTRSLVCIFFVIHCFLQVNGEFDPNAVPHTTKAQLLKSIAAGDEEILVYFYTSFDQCPDCKEKMPSFHEAVEYLDKLEDGNVKSYKLAVKFPEYGVNNFPQLLLFIGNTPFKYDKPDDYGPDSIVDWIEEAKQTPIPELTEETFEHLTQSSTGATTGDWLVMFADGKRPDCMKPNLPDIGTAAVRLRRRKNVAIFDTSSNSSTVYRFGMNPVGHCVKILFFHRTDLYHYKSEDLSSTSLVNFMLEGYTKQEPLTVPPPLDKSSEKLEGMIDQLHGLFKDHASTSELAFMSGVACGLVFVVCAVIFILKRYQKRKLL
uniref:Thioredoxin domain-containing protein n=1 Tax=Ciona intestinalis TaxID=7719 RepID=F7AZA6_CIOIN|nr:thioredoxin domain-containing protein isoform X2 [Ciona intestinalis]|eukprot:XP_009860835.1 thioredoxin domain-containing protein isoform X2 [Ciona intestinalis]